MRSSACNASGVTAIEVRPSFEAHWYRWLQSKMTGTSWTVSNNYFTSETGKVVTQWPYGNWIYTVIDAAARARVGNDPPTSGTP